MYTSSVLPLSPTYIPDGRLYDCNFNQAAVPALFFRRRAAASHGADLDEAHTFVIRMAAAACHVLDSSLAPLALSTSTNSTCGGDASRSTVSRSSCRWGFLVFVVRFHGRCHDDFDFDDGR